MSAEEIATLVVEAHDKCQALWKALSGDASYDRRDVVGAMNALERVAERNSVEI